ncbi:MAG: endospore germination permease [Syntrophomonadaceae bacterium]|nr:endospore germination permease [Syntrophomonadaceae bacterium]
MPEQSEKISSLQLIFLLVGFFMGTAIIYVPGADAGNNAWLAIIAGSLGGLILLWIYMSLATRYPGKNLIEINDLVFGTFAGKLVSMVYLLFFLHVASLVVRVLVEFFALAYKSTPLPILLMAMILVSALVVQKGLEVLCRCSLILMAVLIPAVLLQTMFLLPELDLSLLLPIMDISAREFINASSTVTTLVFAEAAVFLMLLGFSNKPQEIPGVMLKAFLTTVLLLLTLAIRDIAVLGSLSTITTYPSLTAIRLTNLTGVITRVEVIKNTTILTIVFIKFSIFYYALTLGTAQLFKMRTYLPLVYPLGALILGISLLQYDSYVFDLLDAGNLFPFYSLPCNVFLPVITLAITLLKKPAKKQIKDNTIVKKGSGGSKNQKVPQKSEGGFR